MTDRSSSSSSNSSGAGVAINPTSSSSKKKAGPMFLPHGCKKRSKIQKKASKASGNHKHKNLRKCEVRRVAPTLRGVTEASRVMGNGEVLVIPSETVYICCTSLSSPNPIQTLRTSVGSDTATPLILVQNGLDRVASLLSLQKKPYAIRSESPTKPCCFNESMVLLKRLASKYWPGPLTLYVRIPHLNVSSSTAPLPQQSRFVGILNPSHPLASKTLQKAEGEIVIGIPTRFKKASHVWTHYLQSQRSSVYVLNGEDQRELFSVPTCQLAQETFSLWMDEDSRILYIKGRRPENGDGLVKELERGFMNSPCLEYRSRVITAVLRKWKVVDQRKVY